MVVGHPLPKDPATWPPHLPIGRPISGVSVYLLGGGGEPVALGAVGEIYLGGRCPARGYFARPAQTADRFVPDAVGCGPGGRLYRTGDLARYLADGTLQFLGRVDQQVKLRGFRIEPGEVEAVAAEHAGVERAVVLVETAKGESRLLLYAVTGSSSPSAGELKAHLRQRLPEYMVPQVVTFLDVLPLNASGKIDRAALPKPDGAGLSGEAFYVAPETELQEEIAALWREVLAVERVGLHDNFFDLGGHSLRATRLVARVRQVFGIELPVREVFQGPTVAEMEVTITGRLAAGEDEGELAQMLDEIRDLSPEELADLLGDDDRAS